MDRKLIFRVWYSIGFLRKASVTMFASLGIFTILKWTEKRYVIIWVILETYLAGSRDIEFGNGECVKQTSGHVNIVSTISLNRKTLLDHFNLLGTFLGIF